MSKVTGYRPSAVSGAAATVTWRLARRAGASTSEPIAGLTVRPPPAVVVQETLCGISMTLASCSVMLAEAPGCNTREPGSTEASMGCTPRRYDGGASCGAVPQVLGLVPRVQSSVAPAASVENGT